MIAKAALPGPLSRLLRHRAAAGTMLLIAVLAVSSSLLRESTQARLEVEVDRNWRGAYDILVLPPGLELGIEQTDDLVEPNFLGFGGRGGITAEQLDAIRGLDGVDLAAPVMTVGFLRHIDPVPSLFVSHLPSQPTVYRVTLRANSHDGLSERLIQSQVGHIVLGPADLEGQEPPPFVSDLAFSWAVDGVELAFSPLPSLGGMMIAVDPEAEQQLLGSTAEFLRPLTMVDDANRVASSFDESQISESEYPLERLAIEAARSSAEEWNRPVVPLAASEQLYADLTLTVTVDEVTTLDEYPANLDEFFDHATSGDPLITRISGRDLIRPFAAPSLTLLWPGSAAPDGTSVITEVPSTLEATLMHRPEYRREVARPGASGPAFGITPGGLVTAAGKPLEAAEPLPARLKLVVGTEAAYRTLESSQPTTGPLPLYAPVASFDLDTLELPDNPLNYVPLGAYDPPATSYVADEDGTAVTPTSMRGTLNPAGLVSAPPLAITDLAGAVALRGALSIDAVRVRVRNVEDFGASSQTRIEQVANELRLLGLDVRVVAGSSPQPVEVYVPDYYTGEDMTANLGWVEQRWTTLGAAARAAGALGSGTLALLLLALASSAAFALGATYAQQSTRLREIAIQRSLGWDDRQIGRWHVSESLAAGGLLVGIALVGWVILNGGTVGLAVALGVAVTYAIVSAVGSSTLVRVAGQRMTRGGEAAWRPIRQPKVNGPGSYGVRAAVSRPIRLLALGSLLAVAGTAVATGTVIVIDAQAEAGPTLLANFLTDELRIGQLAIVFVISIGAALLAALAMRTDATERRIEWRALSASGWSRLSITEARASELGLSASLATLVTIVGTVVGLSATNVPLPTLIMVGASAVWIVAAAAASASATAAWGSAERG